MTAEDVRGAIHHMIRSLNDDEIARLENALGQPIERPYLVQWVSRAIQAFVVIVTLPPPGERRDDLKEIAEQGRKWIETVEQSRSARLLPGPVDVQHLIGSARTFCQVAESLARQLDQAVGPGHPRTTVALEAFLDRLIGIAKRAKVLPSTPNRTLLGPSDSPPGPPFFAFVNEALDIAMAVIRSSPLPRDLMDAALAGLSKVTDQSLVKALERLRGKWATTGKVPLGWSNGGPPKTSMRLARKTATTPRNVLTRNCPFFSALRARIIISGIATPRHDTLRWSQRTIEVKRAMDTGNDKAAGVRPGALASLLQSVDRKHHPAPNAVREVRGQPQQANRQVELVPVSRLTACKTNARTHSPKQVRQIATSIKRFGFIVPVLVNAENQIVAGHGRVEAAKLLGLTEVPVLWISHLSPAEQRAFVIADNRLAELAGWDRDTLAIELEGLIELDFAVEVTGFDIGEIELILHDGEEDEAGKEKTGAGAKTANSACGPAVSRRGDVWLLGAHQLTCGDSPDQAAYAGVDAAIHRWQKSTGISATLAGCGQTFKAIAQKRRKAAPARRASASAAVPQTPEAA